MWFLIPFATSFVLALALSFRIPGATVLRVLTAALWVAMLNALPAVAAFVVVRRYGIGSGGCLASLILVAGGLLWTLRWLMDPSRPKFQHQVAAPDPILVDQLHDFARRLGRPPPRLAVHNSREPLPRLGGSGCVASPVVFFDEATLAELEPEERGAWLAHELAHHTSGLFWWSMAVAPVAVAIAVAATPWLSFFSVLGLAAVLTMVAFRILSRRIEIICDRRGGELTSPEAMASALAKLHALEDVVPAGWLERLVYTTATYPAPDVRDAELRGAAVPFTRRLDTSLGLVLAIAGSAALIWLAATHRGDYYADLGAGLGLIVIAVTPWWIQVAVGERRRRRRQPRPLPWSGLRRTALALLFFAAVGFLFTAWRGDQGLVIEKKEAGFLVLVLAALLLYAMVSVPAFRARRAREEQQEDRLKASLVDGEEPDPPAFFERLILGGRYFFSASIFYGAVIAVLLLGKAIYGGPWLWVVVAAVAGFLHCVAAFALPRVYAWRGRHRKVIDLCAYNLAAPYMKGRSLREMHSLQIRSLLASGRAAAAAGLLPEVVEVPSQGPSRSLADRARRLTLALEFLSAGLAEVAEELLAGPPERWKKLRPHRDVLLSTVLWSQGRSAEAHALALQSDVANWPPKERAVVVNNLAVYELDLGEEPQKVLERAREAVALDPQRALCQRTLGAAQLYAGGDPAEALELMERPPKPAAPYARSWLDYHRARACERLGRRGDARRYYGRAAEIGGAAGRSAKERLAALELRDQPSGGGP